MKMLIIGVHDKAANMFVNTSFYPSIGLAIRGFTDEINRTDQNNQLNLHPGDFNLYHVGEFDNVSGEVTPRDARCICSGKDIYTGPERTPTVYDEKIIRESLTTGNHAGN